MQVNVSDKIVRNAKKQLSVNPSEAFDKAKEEILNLMRRDLFPRFQKSPEMLELLEAVSSNAGLMTTGSRRRPSRTILV